MRHVTLTKTPLSPILHGVPSYPAYSHKSVCSAYLKLENSILGFIQWFFVLTVFKNC